ncbi:MULTISPECIES: ABC transporter permease [unclassified Bacillus (in: firmicutes)]|uniref:ABC transporter permease n=1 Tax=unclassified Bacillus (in: firmicutes) TaxID=185979 RepID=UPI001BE7CD68|nr:MULTISPECIES: ABC transporter permease [unclassified Bacillus (in: firmicutes)]MBT2615066.1 ABC transporter permease [Bacillus sp. ISL-78]MBT2627683.1 ABC transporter permease [Bacillus sp. ISL-101]MBT2716923.1 ABC transporter permease [Bacillus sp. ISL-57]
MSSALTVLKEQIKHFYLVRRLSVYEVKSANSSNYLGVLWEIINPMIQIAIYWFVFGFIILNRGDDFLPWLMAGIVVWFFVNPAITQTSKSVYSRMNMVSKMSFPMSVIPSYVIFAKLYQHLMLLGVIIILLGFTGYLPTLFILQLPYYVAATVLLLFSLGLITSTLSTIIRDVHNIIVSLMKVMFYLTPILWVMDAKEHPTIVNIMKLNPLYYIVEGYRASLLGESWYLIVHWEYTLYFWAVVIILFMIGSTLHVRFRDRFVDFK